MPKRNFIFSKAVSRAKDLRLDPTMTFPRRDSKEGLALHDAKAITADLERAKGLSDEYG